MKNKHPGKCETCGTRVAAGAGEVRNIQGRWIVFCAAHGSSVATAAAQAVLALVIRIWFEAGRVLCSPATRLNDSFNRYIAATRAAGAGFSREANAQVCSVEKTPALIEELKAAGFTCDVSPDLVATLQARASQVSTDVATASNRAAEIDALLRQTGRSLYGFQHTGVASMAPRRTFLLGDDMGLGKTIQALIALPTGCSVLVVCPAVAKGVWTREIRRFRPDLTATALSGRGSFRWPNAGEVVIANYDILPHVEDPRTVKPSKTKVPGRLAWERMLTTPLRAHESSWTRIGHAMKIEAEFWDAFSTSLEKIGHRYLGEQVLAKCPTGCFVISDEAHALKSSKAARTNRFRTLSKKALATDGRVWLMTATPLSNRPLELWTVLQAAHAANDVFGGWNNYLRMWNATEGRFGIVWGKATSEVAERLKTIMLRRMKVDVLPELPEKTVRTIEVNGLSDSIKKLCDVVLASSVDLKELLNVTQFTANKAPAFRSFSTVREKLAMAKLGAAIEMIEDFEDAEEPVVVFSAHRNPIDTLGKRDGWAVITGDTAPEKRTAIEDKFQRGELKGVACTIKAGGVAITLTRASNAIFIDEEPVPALNFQAQDRVNRIGQTRGVVITRLVAAHALDRRIAELIEGKLEMVEDTVEAARRDQTEVMVTETNTIDTTGLAATATMVAQAQATIAAEEAAVVATVTTKEKSDPGIEIPVAKECPF